ncbi:MAG: YitT family protein [Clostridia bacterium]|nr:YitT family protein [Clostridia bacterium]
MKKIKAKISAKEIITDLIYYIIGCFVYSAAVTALITPNAISPGGFTGIATAVNYLSGISTGFLLLLINIPVIIWGFLKLGGIFIVKSAIATGVLSVCIELSERFVPQFTVDKILASIFGGIFMGAGLSLILRRGATTGGVDIIGTLVNKKFRYITVGRIILISDIIVITFATIVYGDVQSGLYSVVAMYASSVVTDAILYGTDKGKIVYAVTDKPDEICKAVSERIERGVTRLNATGGYTGDSHTMLMCTVRINEVASVCDIIRECDPRAFTVISDAGEVLGEGFKILNS